MKLKTQAILFESKNKSRLLHWAINLERIEKAKEPHEVLIQLQKGV
jgi:hypothetical protein